jgi:hypothetical protein
MTEYDPQADAVKSYYAAIEAMRLRGEAVSKLYCSACDRYERDPMFLDVETCSVCGELVEGCDDD